MLLSGPTRERIGAGTLLVFAIAAAAKSYTYGIGTIRSIGPGLFPFVLSLAIVALSTVTLLQSAASKGEPAEKFSFRIPLTISLAIVCFAIALGPTGLVGAICVAVFVSLLALPKFNLKLAVLLSIALSTACVLIFHWGLNLPISVFGNMGFFQ